MIDLKSIKSKHLYVKLRELGIGGLRDWGIGGLKDKGNKLKEIEFLQFLNS
jgi:hypothetical protein